jgi:hypothetical protein
MGPVGCRTVLPFEKGCQNKHSPFELGCQYKGSPFIWAAIIKAALLSGLPKYAQPFSQGCRKNRSPFFRAVKINKFTSPLFLKFFFKISVGVLQNSGCPVGVTHVKHPTRIFPLLTTDP